MTKLLDTVLLMALPASGKSEVRKFMANLTPEQCVNDMHMGPTLQLDDYPYVHFMHRVDDELKKRGCDYIFYGGSTRPFIDPFEWGTLIELLNEDYDDLVDSKIIEVESAAQYLFDRFDNARAKVGLERALGEIPYRIRKEAAEAMEQEVRDYLKEKNDYASQDKTGKTIVIELARGGMNGAAYPLTPPRGYQYAFEIFSERLLSRASILYVWVTPEESRRKNYERAKPDGQSSILNHGVPLEVMLEEYGCDDMEFLINSSNKKNTVHVERAVIENKNGKPVYVNREWSLPVARFDNRDDLTTFIREEKSKWAKNDYDKMYKGLSDALSILADLS